MKIVKKKMDVDCEDLEEMGYKYYSTWGRAVYYKQGWYIRIFKHEEKTDVVLMFGNQQETQPDEFYRLPASEYELLSDKYNIHDTNSGVFYALDLFDDGRDDDDDEYDAEDFKEYLDYLERSSKLDEEGWK